MQVDHRTQDDLELATLEFGDGSSVHVIETPDGSAKVTVSPDGDAGVPPKATVSSDDLTTILDDDEVVFEGLD